jgi:cold shock CspA family protein
MPRDKRPDEVDREQAPEPTEPLGTRLRTIGIVKFWRDNKGHGAIASEATAPWDIWFHFSAVHRPGGIATLPSGAQFEVTYDEDGRAHSPTGEQVTSGVVTHGEPVSFKGGERVEVTYYRMNQESFRYVARDVRLLEPPDGAA